MPFIADFHIHSHYSMATSRDADLENLYRWARCKGVTLVGSGDFTHPGWRQELQDKLEPAEAGLYRLKDDLCRRVEEDAAGGPLPAGPAVRFIISGEISTIYKQGGRTRKVHHLILLPGLEVAASLSRRLEAIGNLHSDGRPILGLDSRRLLAMTLETCPEAIFIPAHIWTPHFSLFGANSGFDAIEECYGDLAAYIGAVETGLSSDPPMNWRLAALDRMTLVSNSDAHSPRHLAREANLLDVELSYTAIRRALQEKETGGFCGTIEFFPEEGKYHYDGHRACGICWHPSQSQTAGGICPVCGRKLTIGVLHRVEELADREEGFRPAGARPFASLVPLPEVLASALGVGATSKKVTAIYFDLLRHLGPELVVLREVPLAAIARVAGAAVAEAIRRMRAGEVETQPGFDGEYGRVLLLRPQEREFYSGQETLFAAAGEIAVSSETAVAGRGQQGGAFPPVTIARPAVPAPGSKREPRRQQDRPAAAPGWDLPAGQEQEGTGSSPATGAGIDNKAILAGLNQEQRQAVTAAGGPVIVIAGPGTGKTRTLVHRLAYLISVRGIDPGRITAVTFTNKAAGEIRHRVAELLGAGAGSERVTIGTFHSICLDILQGGMVPDGKAPDKAGPAGFSGPGALSVRATGVEAARVEAVGVGTAETEAAGFGAVEAGMVDTGAARDEVSGVKAAARAAGFEGTAAGATGAGAAGPPGRRQLIVLDESDARSLLAEVLRERRQSSARKVLQWQRQIAYLKSRGLLPDAPAVPAELRHVYRAYQERLAAYGVLDYDDILLQAVAIMRGIRAAGGANPEAGKSLLRCSHLLVDEFQDANPVQYQLVQLWAGDGSNLFVIGDPDQAIYGFRGASNRFFGQLQQDYPAAQVWRLTCNYRSTPAILRAAAAVIAHNYETIPPTGGEPPPAAGTSPAVQEKGSPAAAGMCPPAVTASDGRSLSADTPEPDGPPLTSHPLPDHFHPAVDTAPDKNSDWHGRGKDFHPSTGAAPAARESTLPSTPELQATRAGAAPVLHLEVPGETAEGIAIVREIGCLVGGTTMLQAHGQGGMVPEEFLRGREGEREALGFADIAVLARTGRQLETLEACFLQEGIPYRVLGRGSFLEERPVREALAFCRCLVHPADDFHLFRYLGLHRAGPGRAEIALLKEISSQAGVPAWQVLEALAAGNGSLDGTAAALTAATAPQHETADPGDGARGTAAATAGTAFITARRDELPAGTGGQPAAAGTIPPLPRQAGEKILAEGKLDTLAAALAASNLKPATRERLLACRDILRRYRAMMATQTPAGLLACWLAERDLKAEASLDRLLRVAARFSDLPSFLRGVTLAGEGDHERYGSNTPAPEAVSLMTIHAAKGLEFPVVFIAGVEDGLLPLQKNPDLAGDQGDIHDLQEEPSIALADYHQQAAEKKATDAHFESGTGFSQFRQTAHPAHLNSHLLLAQPFRGQTPCQQSGEMGVKQTLNLKPAQPVSPSLPPLTPHFPHLLSEERRLFYVGLTRARDILILVSSRSRSGAGIKKPARPSPFLQEIPPDCLEERAWTGKARGEQSDDEGKYKQLSLF